MRRAAHFARFSLAPTSVGRRAVGHVARFGVALHVALALLVAGCSANTGFGGGYYVADTFSPAQFGQADGAVDGLASDDGSVDGATADATGVDTATSDAGFVDMTAVDGSAPDTMAPDTIAPDTMAPDTIAPDTIAPDTGTADTSAPDTMAPDTVVAPDTVAPDTTAQDTTAPDAGSSDAGGAVAATIGALVITEFHPDPVKVTDANGEWFEVYNPTDQAVHLGGLSVADNTSAHLVVDGASIIVAAKSYFVFAVKGEGPVNGGVQAGYVYKSVTLNNGGDLIRLQIGTTVIDEITYAIGSLGWPEKAPGAAIQLDPTKLNTTANDAGSAWCLAKTTYGAGDLGTPGAPNTTCP